MAEERSNGDKEEKRRRSKEGNAALSKGKENLITGKERR